MNRAPRRGSGTGWAIAAVLAVAAVSWIGCDSASKWPDPAEQLPGWLYDAPFYAMPQPENDPQALDGGLDGQIPHYYIREPVIPIKRPDTSPAGKTPRLAVFWSNDHGQVWHKAGYFGLDSAYFSFVAPGEGTYGIRFVGPGIEPTRLKDSAAPHRVYHVDTTPPSVIVQVYPAKDFYLPGEAVTLVWSVTDANIDRDGKVAIYLISPPAKVIPMPAPFPLNGSVGIIVPDLAQDGGVRYGVEAVDKAGNIGRGFSFLVRHPAPARWRDGAGADQATAGRPVPRTRPNAHAGGVSYSAEQHRSSPARRGPAAAPEPGPAR